MFTLSSPVISEEGVTLGVAAIDISVVEVLETLNLPFFNQYNYLFFTTSSGKYNLYKQLFSQKCSITVYTYLVIYINFTIIDYTVTKSNVKAIFIF